MWFHLKPDWFMTHQLTITNSNSILNPYQTWTGTQKIVTAKDEVVNNHHVMQGQCPLWMKTGRTGQLPHGWSQKGEERRNEPSTILTAFSGNPSNPWCSTPVTSSLSATQTQFTPPGGDCQQWTNYYPWDTPRPAIGMAPTRSMELIKSIWREGIMVNAIHNEGLPLEAQSITEDLIFQLSQKQNEVTHLQHQMEYLWRESLLHKWEDVGEPELCPLKQRENWLEEVVPSPIDSIPIR